MQLTSEQRRARAQAIIVESERSGRGIVDACRVVNGRLSQEAARNSVKEAASQRRGPSPKAAKRAERIAQAITESLAASKATTPARPAAQAPAKPPTPLHEASRQQIDEAVLEGVGSNAASPFWAGQPSTSVSVTESATEPGPDLSTMSPDAFAAHCSTAFSDYGRAAGLSSPLWAA